MNPKANIVRRLLDDGNTHTASSICLDLSISQDTLEGCITHLRMMNYLVLIGMNEGGDLYYQRAGGLLPWEKKQDVIDLSPNFIDSA